MTINISIVFFSCLRLVLATKAEQVAGRLEVARAEAERAANVKRATARAEVRESEAESSARIALAEVCV